MTNQPIDEQLSRLKDWHKETGPTATVDTSTNVSWVLVDYLFLMINKMQSPKMPTQDVMTHYVIYKSPKDYPGRYVVRRWLIRGKSPDDYWPENDLMANEKTLNAARAAIHREAADTVCLKPFPEDHPVIVEVWI